MIVVAVISTGISSSWVYSLYQDVKRQSAAIESEVFRDSVAVFRDLWQIDHFIDGLLSGDDVSQEDVFEFQKHVDFLYVRTQDLRQQFERIDAPDPKTLELLQGFFEVIAFSDAILENEVGPDAEFLERTRPRILELSRGVMELLDEQYFSQSKSIGAQTNLVRTLTYSAIAVLCLFGGVAAAASLLLQRQLRVRAKHKKAEDKANFLAFYDALTGLPNRIRFRDFAEKLIEDNEDPVVFLFDLDDFKLVNDIHGHLAGDAVLLRCAREIEDWASEFDGIPARLGGDEFAAILPGPMSSMKIASLCEQLLARLGADFEYEGVLLSPKMSIGVAAAWSLETEEELTLSQLQKAADVALYRAKEQGKHTYAFFDGDLAQIAARRREIEIGIGEALANDDFALALQPQVDLTSGQIRGFEALARWTRDGEAISPGEFVPVAEATGQVVDLDIWGLRKATLEIAGWIRNGKLPLSISVNLSPLHFRSDEIVSEVARALADSGLPPHLLTLEITETVLIEDLSKVTMILEKLRDLGVRIALDDFGTGYSSLAYLRRLKVDYIKIDQSFVRDLEQSSETQLILDALVDISKGLRKMVVVEGIETEVQAELIRTLGCDIGQGYLWGRPMPVEEAVAQVPTVEEALNDAIAS